MFEPNQFHIIDGGMGSLLQSRGLKSGEQPELFLLEHPDVVLDIHNTYARDADIITACTFGANRLKLGSSEKVREVIAAALGIAKQSGAKTVALDIGPLGTLLAPIGTLSFDEAYELFREQVEAGVSAGAELVIIETIADLLEMKAAVLAVKENSDLPVIATMTFESDGRTFLGTDAVTAAVALSSWGVDALGVNCSLGPDELLPVVTEMLRYASVPVAVQPNAGLPVIENGETTYKITPEAFAASCAAFADRGVLLFGGCCGTTPAHIHALREMLQTKTPVTPIREKVTAVTSGRKTVILDGDNVRTIGERINPTGKKRLKEALRGGDFGYVVDEALAQESHGADILDVNAGLPEIDEAATLVTMIQEIQSVCPLPLQIDSSDPETVERASRIYCGKPIINSVNGTEESMAHILPIVKKYGAAVVALTLDEAGIPESAEARLQIAEKIVDRAEQLGIPRADILVDCLVLTVSTHQHLVRETLRAVTLVRQKLGVRTVLGVSNVSFGMPARERINAAFLAEALGAGLDLPILNPLSDAYRAVVMAHRVIANEDRGGKAFIEAFSQQDTPQAKAPEQTADLKEIIISGRKSMARAAVQTLLETKTPLEIINTYFIPALDAVGAQFEQGTLFLPQLMASAQTVKNGFDAIKDHVGDTVPTKGKIVLATVKGDIHDIGKNIVKMLLQNYGYDVIDLGKDVAPQAVADAVRAHDVKLVGLSALMTTTVRAMKDTIDLLRAQGLDCRVMVGGAVLNREYAAMVGADFYVSDATESAKTAALVLGK